MDRYQMVDKPRPETPINENEIRITTQGRMRSYITYATTLLQHTSHPPIGFNILKAGLSKSVLLSVYSSPTAREISQFLHHMVNEDGS